MQRAGCAGSDLGADAAECEGAFDDRSGRAFDREPGVAGSDLDAVQHRVAGVGGDLNAIQGRSVQVHLLWALRPGVGARAEQPETREAGRVAGEPDGEAAGEGQLEHAARAITDEADAIEY